MDHAGTVGRFTIYWDRPLRAFVVYSSTDEMIYKEPPMTYDVFTGKPVCSGLTAFQWAERREQVLRGTFGDV
jgi:hypothetical protein